MKKYIITISSAICLIVCIFISKNAYYDNIPTADTAKMTRIMHTDFINADGEIIKLQNNNSYVKVCINEEDISKIKAGQSAVITGTAFPGKKYAGVVDKIATCATKQYIGTVQKTVVLVNIKILNDDDLIKSGYSAFVNIKISQPECKNIIPYEAVNQDSNGEFVYVFNNGIAIRKNIETGMELSDGIEIKEGIDYSDTILEYNDKIKEGKPVKLQSKTEVSK